MSRGISEQIPKKISEVNFERKPITPGEIPEQIHQEIPEEISRAISEGVPRESKIKS